MRKIFGIILFLIAFVWSADYKPFNFESVAEDSVSQQTEFDYMLQYKLYGRDYLKVGNDVSIPDKSGWNGTSGYMTSNARLELGGPVLVAGDITLGDQQTLTTGPIRANSMSMGNDNGSFITGKVCLTNPNAPAPLPTIISRSEGKLLNATDTACSTVPASPNNLSMPTIVFPDTATINITVPDRGKVFVDIPDVSNYDLYINSIRTGTEDTLYFRMANRGTLTRIFVKDEIVLGNHTVLQTYYGDSAVAQDKYRGNLLFYTQKDFNLVNSDNGMGALQGTFISTQKIYFQSNIKFAGQLLANQLELGNTFDGKNFRYVKFDPDTLDFPELNKQGGLRENDSTVIIPIQLSDTSTIDVYFTYCFELKNGVTIDDFNMPPYLPICGNSSITTKIPIGGKTPLDTIKVNVKIDTLTEPNDILVMHIDSITGAVLPNGETSGELTIKIIDAPNSHVSFDTTTVYKFNENATGVVDLIKVINKTDSTKFYLDSAFTDRYTLDSTTGELKLVKYPLDYEKATVDVIKVTLKDTGNVVVTRNIPITVVDVNEAPTLNDTTLVLSENVPIPSIVGILKASDPDKVTVFTKNEFTIVEGNSNFAIDPKTGRITATKIFNFETDSAEYKLKVKVFDTTDPTLCDSAIVTIKIGNTNEGPKFNTKDTTFFVDENTAPGIIGSVPAIDEDGDKITYKIVGTVPFTIDTAGNISSTRQFDYETETGFTFKVVASDGTLSDTVKVNVRVNNVNEPCEVKDTTFSIKENTTGKIGNVNATDKDKDSIFGTIKYSISDSVNYQIDKDGNVFVKTPFNYEDKKVDSVKVYITDGKFKDTATVVVKVIDVPEDIVIAGKVDPVEENVELGTLVGVITGKDGDSTDVTYSINTIDFKIDPITGVITTNSNIDYETKNEYPVTVTAKSTDGSKKDTSFVIKVLNVNEPVHVNDTTLTVPENYTGPIGKVEGKDDDREPVKYSVRDSNDYSIDSLGNISIIKPLDYEKTKLDTLVVDVTTPSGDKDSAIVIINVKNVNEDPKLQPNDTLTVPENCKSCIVGIITAIDPDNDTITYSVKEPGFTIDSSGVLKLTEPLDYEKTPVVTITVIAKDPSGAADTATYKIKVTDVNEPVHVNDTTCSVKENYTGKVCQIKATDEDKTNPKFFLTDTTNYQIDSIGNLIIKNPIDFEKKTKDSIKVIVTDGELYDTATVIIRVLDEPETVEITTWDDEKPKDTVKTNDPGHKFEWELCEGDSCIKHEEFPHIKKDTTIKVCNDKKTACDSIVVLFNDAPPVVTLTNAKSTDALIDYITIEEEKDNKIYVNKKENPITVTVKDTIHKTEKKFEITVKLDTIPTKNIKVTEYNYLIDETIAKSTPIGNGLTELSEVVSVDGIKVVLTKVVDKTGKAIDTTQTITYIKKVNGKDVTVSYKVDNLTGQRISDYEVSYNIDSCTAVSYKLNDKKEIVKNEEGNIAYTITYDYTDDFGNKATASVEIVYDDIPPKVEILDPIKGQVYKTNAIPVKWTVNGEVQDTLNLQRLEKGVNLVIRRYVDKAGNVTADTIMVIMKEAKDIDISIVHPVTEINQDKVDSFYNEGNKYNPTKPYMITILKGDEKPDPVGVGFKVDIALPSVSPMGSLATLDDITKNGQIPVDDNGNIVGASTHGIPVDQYVEEHCTEEFKQDYKKHGLNIPLYDVKYNLHLWVYTTQANYVNDFNIEYTLNDEDEATSAGTITMVVDYLADRDGNVKAKNHKALGTSSYITKLFSKSVAKHRCDYKEQVKGDRTVKKDQDMTIFGYKRPKTK